jgi:hypothetical protein
VTVDELVAKLQEFPGYWQVTMRVESTDYDETGEHTWYHHAHPEVVQAEGPGCAVVLS